MLADAAVTWPAVALALITALPGIIAALAGLSVRRSVKTPSKMPIGEQVEAAHHVALANNYALHAAGVERRQIVRDAKLPAEPKETLEPWKPPSRPPRDA